MLTFLCWVLGFETLGTVFVCRLFQRSQRSRGRFPEPGRVWIVIGGHSWR
jgi:hypothetical protein